MNFFKYILFCLCLYILSSCSGRESLEDILTNYVWKVDEVELALDVDIDEEMNDKMINTVLSIVKGFDIHFTEDQELEVWWNESKYVDDKVLWELNKEDSTLIFSLDNVKNQRLMKIKEISSKKLVLHGKIDENTVIKVSPGEGTITMKSIGTKKEMADKE